MIINWHTPLWITTLCLLVACSSGTSSSEPSSTQELLPSTTSEPLQGTTASPSLGQTTAITPKADLEDVTIIPGEQVGPVTRQTSRTDLGDLFGEAALQDMQIPVGEGFTESGTIVNAGTEQAFSIIWVDESQTQPATIKDFGAAWQTSEGLKVGTSFTELQTVLGSFSLYGFGWDYEGTLVLAGSTLDQYDGLLILRLQPETAAIEQFPEAYQAVLGDKLLTSNDPNLLRLNLAVNEMIVYLTPPAQ